MTEPGHIPPAEVLERYAAARPTMQKFYDMAVNFFRCKCLSKSSKVFSQRKAVFCGQRWQNCERTFADLLRQDKP